MDISFPSPEVFLIAQINTTFPKLVEDGRLWKDRKAI